MNPWQVPGDVLPGLGRILERVYGRDGQAIALALAERGAVVIATDLAPPHETVVNNAGYFPNRSIDELDLPTWRKTFATNLDSHFLSAKCFLPTMRKKKWGRFVGISSNMVGLAIPGMSHYIATKIGIIGYAGDCTSIGRTKTRHLGTAGDQAAGRTGGCYRRSSILDQR